jgi:protein tyrosine/serine phosphatase
MLSSIRCFSTLGGTDAFVAKVLMSDGSRHSVVSVSTTTEAEAAKEEQQQRTAVNSADEAAEKEFLAKTKLLCEERNIAFAKIKNARDLASVQHSPVAPNKIIRMGRPGDATTDDLAMLRKLQIKTLIDLRSPTELKDDESLMREEVYGNYTNILWKEQGRFKEGCTRELAPGENPLPRPFWRRSASSSSSNNGNNKQGQPSSDVGGGSASLLPMLSFSEDDDEVLRKVEEDEECGLDCPEDRLVQQPGSSSSTARLERHFCSLMNEFKYVKGTVSKMRKRDLTKAILTSPGAMFSSRMRQNLKKPFLDEINDGGLNMLNQLLLRFGAPGIRYVLQVVADESRHPVAFYCTAGKDRTGALAAIILSLCGADVEDIVEDYTLSANVYAEMGDHKAMVGALSQRNLDPKTFLGAPASVMRETLHAIEEEYGSVEGYCNWIGFGPEQQERLRKACMKSST